MLPWWLPCKLPKGRLRGSLVVNSPWTTEELHPCILWVAAVGRHYKALTIIRRISGAA